MNANTSIRNLMPVSVAGALSNSRKVSCLDDAIYHADLHIQSCSMLKAMLVSPAHYQYGLVNRRGSTPQMEFGSLVHLLTLEPHLLLAKAAIFPGVKTSARDKDYKDFVASHPGQMIFDEPTFHMAEIARDKLLNQKVLGRLFGDFLSEGEAEASMYYTDPDTGVECRCRVDLRHPEANFDLKTTAYVSTPAWVRHAIDLDYDLQAYMYSLSDCLYSGREEPLPFYFMSVTNDYPLCTHARRAGLSFMMEGARKYKHAISAYAACAKADYWPAPGGEEVVECAPWQAAVLDTSWAEVPTQ